MRNEQSILDILDAAAKRRAARRDFLRTAGMATAAAGGLAVLAACHDNENGNGGDQNNFPTPPTGTVNSGDVDILNFALNLEYLEAQFYSYAVLGTGLNASLLTGVGTQGAVATSASGGPRAVDFSGETLIGQYAREIAADEIAHVTFLRTALGSAAVAQPAINISGDATGSFTAAARAAGVVDKTTGLFDPYASPDNFLIGAFIFEDVGVTAYKGSAPQLVNKVYTEAAAGILAAEAYHAGLIRSVLYNRGQSNAALITNTGKISDLRDTLDGAPTKDDTRGIGPDDDQPITDGAAPTYAGNGNIVPANVNGIAYSRTPAQVLHIVYATAAASATSGGFFPAGVNGNIKTAT